MSKKIPLNFILTTPLSSSQQNKSSNVDDWRRTMDEDLESAGPNRSLVATNSRVTRDNQSLTWSRVSPSPFSCCIPPPRSGAASVVVKGRLYMFGVSWVNLARINWAWIEFRWAGIELCLTQRIEWSAVQERGFFPFSNLDSVVSSLICSTLLTSFTGTRVTVAELAAWMTFIRFHSTLALGRFPQQETQCTP